MRSITDYNEEEKAILSGLKCPYCGNDTELIDSKEIYHGVSYGMMYICRPCNAYVGCYNESTRSLGRVANEELREYKKQAHHYFDQIWKRRINHRLGAYKYLSDMMGTPIEYTHIGMYDIEQCKQVIKISIDLLHSRGKEPYPYNDKNESTTKTL